MDFAEILLIFLATPHVSRRRMAQSIKYGSFRPLYKKFPDVSQAAIRVVVGRLISRGLLSKENFSLTSKGREELERKTWRLNKSRDLIISFDIPESLRGRRKWLRNELRQLEFRMVQQSFWIGPAPLPAYFMRGLIDKELVKYVKFFTAKETDIIGAAGKP